MRMTVSILFLLTATFTFPSATANSTRNTLAGVYIGQPAPSAGTGGWIRIPGAGLVRQATVAGQQGTVAIGSCGGTIRAIMFNITYSDASAPASHPAPMKAAWNKPNDPEAARGAINSIVQSMLNDGWTASYSQGSSKRFRKGPYERMTAFVAMPGRSLVTVTAGALSEVCD